MRYATVALLLGTLFTAAAQAGEQQVDVEVVQDKLDHPWSLAFLPDGQGALITLRGGELLHWVENKGVSAPIAGVPKVWASEWFSLQGCLHNHGSIILRCSSRARLTFAEYH